MPAGKIREYALRTSSWNSQITSLKAPNRNENGFSDKMLGYGGKIEIWGE